MKRLLLTLFLLLLGAGYAGAQGTLYQLSPPAPNAQVLVCPSPDNGYPCPAPAAIFSNVGLTIAVPQPVQLGSSGFFSFYIASGTYTIQLLGPGYNSGNRQVVSIGSSSGSEITPVSSLPGTCTAGTSGQISLSVTLVVNGLSLGAGTVLYCDSTNHYSPVSQGSGAAPVMGFYLSPQCPPANTGQCFYTAANTQQANACSWTAATPSTVTCLSQTFGGTVSGNGTTVVFTVLNVPSGWAIGNSITVTNSSSGTFNITCTISAVTTTTISCLNAASGSGTLGYITNSNIGPFISAAVEVGKQAMGWNNCTPDSTFGSNAITATGAPVITAFTSSTTVSITSASNAQVATTGCFIWGTPDDTAAAAVEAAYDLITGYCPKLYLAAANYMFTNFHFNSTPPGCVSNSAAYGGVLTALNTAGIYGAGQIYYPAGFELEGRGTAATTIYLTPNFPTSTCNNGNLGNACFSVPVLGRWRDFQITGGGNSAAVIGNNNTLIYCEVCELNNITVLNIGNNLTSGNIFIAVQGGYQAQFTFLNVSAGAIGIDIPTGRGVVQGFRVYSENSGYRALSVDGPPGASGATQGYSFTCKYCGFYDAGNNSAVAGQNLISNAGGSIDLEDTQIGPLADTAAASFGYRCQTTSGCVLYLRNSQIKMPIGSTGIICSVACTNYLQNTSVSSGIGGNTYVDVAGSKLFDQCGNSFLVGTLSISGSVFGSCSITGTALAASNLTPTSGFGTGCSTAGQCMSAVSGTSQLSQFTVTYGTTPSSPQVLTVVFPTPFLVAPLCRLTDVGGTNAFPTSIVTTTCTATGASFTITNTPVGGSTDIFQLQAGNP
jgi:hypothetical protein